MTQYRLADEELSTRFERGVVRDVFRQHEPSTTPTLVLLGAQPAAGKSEAHARLLQQYPDLVPLDGDALCRFHPSYHELMETDPVAMSAATAQASSAWMKMSIDHAREQRYSLLLENTFHNPDMTTTAKEFAEDGYRVHVVALGVDEKISRIDSVNRYLSPGPDADRWAPQLPTTSATATLRTLFKPVKTALTFTRSPSPTGPVGPCSPTTAPLTVTGRDRPAPVMPFWRPATGLGRPNTHARGWN